MPERSSNDNPKRPRDVNQLAKAITDEATGQTPPAAGKPADAQKNAAAVELGRRGGKVGGKARAAKLTPEQRSGIAKKAAAKRWGHSES